MARTLLQRICEHPSDLELRQVYADELIDAGDPRGTFISHQIALGQLDSLDERVPVMFGSVRRLELEHRAAWLGDLADRGAVFENGFLDRVSLLPDEIEEQWKVLSAREPISGIELLVHEALPDESRELEAPHQFRTLKVTPEGWFAANSFAEVLAWGMPHLEALDLTKCDLGPTGARLLANQATDLGSFFDDFAPPPPFSEGQLERLVLRGCGLTDEGAAILFGATHLSKLVELDLGQCRLVDPNTLEALRRAEPMRSLRRLSLAGNNTLTLEKLSTWPVLGQLEHLALPQSMTADVLRSLFPTPSSALRSLDLRSARGLLETPGAVLDCARSFTSLDLGTTSLGDEGLSQLVQHVSTRSLLHLKVNGCSLSDEAVEALVKSPLDRLVTLDLSSNKLTDAALERLAGWKGLGLLVELRLGNNRKLSKKGFDALAKATAFQPALLDLGKLPTTPVLRSRFGAALTTDA